MYCQTKILVLFWSILEILDDKQISTFAISICRQQEIPQLVNQANVTEVMGTFYFKTKGHLELVFTIMEKITFALFPSSDPISKF